MPSITGIGSVGSGTLVLVLLTGRMISTVKLTTEQLVCEKFAPSKAGKWVWEEGSGDEGGEVVLVRLKWRCGSRHARISITKGE